MYLDTVEAPLALRYLTKSQMRSAPANSAHAFEKKYFVDLPESNQ